MLSINAPAPHGLGRSVIVDPEGNVRYQAGATEEVITDVLDFGAVDRVRGSAPSGLNRVWDQLDTSCRLDLPVYGGRYQPRPTPRPGDRHELSTSLFIPTATPRHTGTDVAAKGLRAGSIGLFGSSVLGVVQTAPAYSIAVTVRCWPAPSACSRRACCCWPSCPSCA